MSMTLNDLALEELLPHLAERNATGTLAIETRLARKKLYLLDGQLGGVNSSDPREFLGHFLVGWGLIDEPKLREAMELQDRLGTPLGRILERIGAVDGESLESALRAQAEEALIELFLVPVADKRFLANVVPSDRPLALRLALEPLVLEGVRRRQRLAELEAVLGSLDVIPARTAAAAPAGLSGREHHILGEIDGVRDLDAVALACHLVRFHVAEFVAQGVAAGFLEVRPTGRKTSPDAPDVLVARAESALAAGDLRRCFDDLHRLRTLPTDHAANRRAQELERGVAEALAQRRIAGSLIPQVLAEPGSGAVLALTPPEMFVLSRIDKGWTLREIQRISPLEELHFGVVIDTLLKFGLIELRHPKGGTAVS